MHVSGAKYDSRAHIYSLLKGTVHDVREYLELAMGMGVEALMRLDAVFIDDTERTIADVLWVIVPAGADSVTCSTFCEGDQHTQRR